MLKGDITTLESSISGAEEGTEVKSLFITSGFQLTIACFILSIATTGIGDSIFGYHIFAEVSTLFIFLALTIQVVTGTLRYPKILALIFAYIIIHAFIVGSIGVLVTSLLKSFIGLVIFSISTFSFISTYRDRIGDIVRIYYKFVFVLAGIGVLQSVLFVLFRISILPQNILSGGSVSGMANSFYPEILGIFPRSVGLSSEPAHYAIIILPGVFISLLVLTGRANNLGIQNKTIAKIILAGFVLSFSIVGYFGLILCLISIFASDFKGKLITNITILLFSIGVFYLISQTSLMSKVSTLPTMFSDISSYEYTSSDLTGFALASNVIVAGEGLKKSHYLGTGFNTHRYTYDEMIYKIFSSSQVLLELNREDAGSLFVRLISEFGIPGILLFVFFLYHYRLGKSYPSSEIKVINSMSLVILIGYATRHGEYLSVFFFFFLALYYYSYITQQDYEIID